MLDKYEIKYINNKPVLFLYLDLDHEFDFNVKDIINKNKILFAGTLVAIVVNGIVVGGIDLKKDTNNIIASTYVEKDINIEPEEIKKELVILENNTDIKEEQSKKEVKKENKIIETKKDTNNVIKKESVIEEKPIIDTNTYVKIKRKNGEIENIELEEYIIGVVSAEMPAEFNIEALKAQSILARTYALKSVSEGKTLSDTESTQSYKDTKELKNIWQNNYDKYFNKIKSAVDATKGMYLTYNGKYIEAVYHSTSNGKTEYAKNVWGNDYPYLVSVDSTYDSLNKSFYSEKSFTYEKISELLNMDINYNTEFIIISKTEGNRVKEISINDTIFTGIKIRSLLGLRSADFEINKLEDKIIFKTKGYGHGVGMSQYGANGMAKNGFSYKAILNHYYPGTTLSYK